MTFRSPFEEVNGIRRGDRVRPSNEALDRRLVTNKVRNKLGTAIGFSRDGNGIRVRWDSQTYDQTLHYTFVEKATEDDNADTDRQAE